jgi:colicin import membrane protein
VKGAESSGWSSWWLSILLHLLVLAGIGAFLVWHRSPPPVEQRLAIEASVVMQGPARAVPETPTVPVPEPVAELPPEPAPQPEVEAEKERQVEAERAAEAARVAEAERVAEQRRVAEARLAAQREADETARAKAERDKQEREKKDRDRKEREQKEREKLERERLARVQAAAEQARLQRESELNAQIAAEERANAARAGVAGQQYIAQIKARIESKWSRPPGATPGTQCEIRVTQIPGGVVTGVQVVRCNRDETVRQSIEDAVHRSSPLPQPADPALFDRNLTITFRPEN